MGKNLEDLINSFDDDQDRVADLDALAGSSSSLDEFLKLTNSPESAEASKPVVKVEKPNSCFYCDCEPIAELQSHAVCEFHLLNDGECSKCHKGASTPTASVVEGSTSQTLPTPQAEGQVDTSSNSGAPVADEEKASTGVLATNQAEYNEEFKQIFNSEFILLQQSDSLVFAEERKDKLERFIRECKIKIAAVQSFQDDKSKRARKDELAAWEAKGKELAARKPRAPKAESKKAKAGKTDEEIIREQLTKLNLPAEYIEQMVAEHKAAKGLK